MPRRQLEPPDAYSKGWALSLPLAVAEGVFFG